MPATPGIITVTPPTIPGVAGTIATQVTITAGDSGSVAAYTTANGSTAFTFPASIDAETSFHMARVGTYLVSCKVGNQEVATREGNPARVFAADSKRPAIVSCVRPRDNVEGLATTLAADEAFSSQFLPLPTGTPTVGQVPVVSNDDPLATEWGAGGGGGGGSLSVKEAGTEVAAEATVLDFGAGFDVTESPSGEANIALDLSEYTGVDLPVSAGGTGASDAATARTNLGVVQGTPILDWAALGNLGATETVSGSPGAVYRAYGTLDQGCTVTISLQNNEQIELILIQDGTGGRATTFSGVTSWTGGTPSTGSRTAGQADRYSFERVNGVTYGYWITA